MRLSAIVVLAVALAGCQTSGSGTTPVVVTPQTSLATVMAYACPLAGTIQVSALILTPAQRNIVNQAAGYCTLDPASLATLNPTTVATILVEAAVILQQQSMAPRGVRFQLR